MMEDTTEALLMAEDFNFETRGKPTMSLAERFAKFRVWLNSYGTRKPVVADTGVEEVLELVEPVETATISGMVFDVKVTVDDPNRYFVSARKRLSIFGWRLITLHAPIRLEEHYSIDEVREAMDKRLLAEPYFYIGTRDELIDLVKSLTVESFDRARNLEYYRTMDALTYVDEYVEHVHNPLHVLECWLTTAIASGLTTYKDIVVRDHEVSFTPGSAYSASTLRKAECHPRDFIRVYRKALLEQYHAMPTDVPVPPLEFLARDLIREQMAQHLGLMAALKAHNHNDCEPVTVYVHQESL